MKVFTAWRTIYQQSSLYANNGGGVPSGMKLGILVLKRDRLVH